MDRCTGCSASHFIARGIERCEIFRDDAGRNNFLDPCGDGVGPRYLFELAENVDRTGAFEGLITPFSGTTRGVKEKDSTKNKGASH